MFKSNIGVRKLRHGAGRIVAGGLAALMLGTALVASGGGIVPAIAAEGASLGLVKQVKQVNGAYADEARDLRPGDSVSYRIEFRVNDEDADAPVRVTDALPAAFSGWEISELSAVVGGSTANVTLDLPGVTSGPSPSMLAAGTIGSTAEDRTITVGVEQPVQAGAGNEAGLGMSTRDTGVLEYTLTIPADLSPTDPILRTDLVNTATFSAKAGAQELRTTDTALITVDNPITVDVTPTKTWTPAGQSFQPGQHSLIAIGATQASNVDANSLSLSDPADAALAPEGATELPAANPFSFVDFAGFTAPVDPTSNLPKGATTASVEVYRLSGGTWNWVDWEASIPNANIAGVRTTYEGSIPSGATVSQGFTVAQRSENRASGESNSTGYTTSNEVRATVTVPGEEPVSKDAEAPFEVGAERIDVTALKHFYSLPAGDETTKLTGVTAGDSVGVVLRGGNGEVPASTVLDSLTIAEPVVGSDSRFFGTDLIFAGFMSDDTSAIWPAGATGAKLIWTYSDDSTEAVALAAADPLPAPASGKTVAGFELIFTGAIAPGATSEVRYQLDSNSAETFVEAGGQTGNLTNTIEVTGEKVGLEPDTSSASATVAYVAPKIDVNITKRVGPGTVMPGQDVVVQLDTEVKTSGGRTHPTEIVVEDVLGEDGTFWDAFDAQQILPPITRPTNGGTPIVTATLTIRYQDADGEWQLLAKNPDENTAIDVPDGTTGLRFVYTNDAGFSQTTYVKPNISFTARATLRSDSGVPTGTADFTSVKRYENVATVTSAGMLDDRIVTGEANDSVDVGVRGEPNGGPGIGGVWADKDWAHSSLTSQSHATTWTTQSWAVTRSGFTTVELTDPAAPTASGAGTVFEAFDLTHIRPIDFSGSASSATIDPQLRWDLVTDVQLWDGTAWESVDAPDGSWMDPNGFTGYTLSAAEQQRTIGVRLVLAENTEARKAAEAAGDLVAPAAGSGVAASAEIRTYRLDWQLRESARTADGSLKWVKETDTSYNCEGESTGCVDNVFGVAGVPESGNPMTDTENATIQLVDGAMNVRLTKQVQAVPGGTAGDGVQLVAPNAGELEQVDYPSARYTLTARNSSTMPEGARGAMQLAKLRVTDTSTSLDAQPADINLSAFAGRDFAGEVASQDANHFNEFTLTGVSFGTIPDFIDRDESTVELWLYDGDETAGTAATYTLAQVLANDAGFIAQLPQAIGVAVTFSGKSPETQGNTIPTGIDLVTYLDVQLRAAERLSGDPVRGGGIGSVENVPNQAVVRGWDAVIAPDNQPTSRDTANVELTQAKVNVLLEKSVSVDHAGTENQTLYEADPQAPVSVLLTATPAGSTAPLNTLRIEDATTSFWDRFELVSFGTPQLPRDADRATAEVLVGDAWVAYANFEGDRADVRGVRMTFDREDRALFPLGATSWNASWNQATLPLTVQLREGAVVDWNEDSETNLATVTATNLAYGTATWVAGDTVDFSPGVHQLRVEKRAPNDSTTHQVEALASMPWKLIFTNTGSSYLPIVNVTDALPANLDWDGEEPVVVSTPGTTGESGLSEAPGVTISDDGRSLEFEWPTGARMEPGERVEIALGLIMQPMTASSRALNEVIVETGVDLAVCEQPTEFGQAPNTPASATECSNTNYVQPRIGTVIGVRKTVSGEPVDTLGENLVSGALDTRTLEECQPGNYFPVGSDYTRNPCASYTAVGATDTWKLENINSGTNPLARMTVVDMLPRIGDRMLSGGAARGSTFAPVLADTSNIRLVGLPEGASYTIDVTENAAACVGTETDSSLWTSDPTCENQTTNPANVWTSLEDYAGDVSDIAGLRFNIDMSASPLQPGGNVIIEFETINAIGDGSNEQLQATLAQFEERQFAWNQNGAIAWDTTGTRVNLPASPQRAGVTVKTGSLVVSKETTGLGADRAPESFTVELFCTVPSGLADPERVTLDLGNDAVLTVPKNGSVTLDGLPVGTNCVAQEQGEVGTYLENTRAIDIAPNVSPSSDGITAEVKIRDLAAGEATQLSFINGYAPIPPTPVDPDSPEPSSPEGPEGLSLTGASGIGFFAAAAALILLLGAALAVAGTVRERRYSRDTLTT